MGLRFDINHEEKIVHEQTTSEYPYLEFFLEYNTNPDKEEYAPCILTKDSLTKGYDYLKEQIEKDNIKELEEKFVILYESCIREYWKDNKSYWEDLLEIIEPLLEYDKLVLYYSY